MSEYMQRKKPDAYTQPKPRPNQKTAEQTREAQLRELEYNLTRKPMCWLTQKQEEENESSGLQTFVVPEGWGLKQIADHLNVSTDELKTRNKSKLQNWNGVEGFFAGEKIIYSAKSNSGEKKEEKKEVAENPEQIIANAYSSYTNDEITMPEFSKAILPYVESHGSSIATLLLTRGSFNADSLAFALAQNSPKDSDLARFDRNVLEIMSDQLDAQATGNKEDNQFQKQRVDKILKLNLTHQAVGLKEIIDNDKGEEEKNKQIIAYVRKQFEEYPPKVKALKESPNFTPEQKVKIAGKISVQAAKLEFLMGTIYHKGKEWEEKKGKRYLNKGFMVDHYTKQSSYRGTPEYDPWCSKFVTTVMNSVLGISANHATKSENRRGAWGGSQIVNGYENFWNYDEDKGGKLEGQQKVGQSNIWKKINKQVSGKTSKKDKVKLLKEFFNKNIYPQPGDIMIVDPSGNNSFKESAKNGFDSSHTAMIEKVLLTNEDAFIYTIEGNSGQKVTGRRYDLTKTSGKFSLSWIINISRMSTDNYARSSSIRDQIKIKSIQFKEINENAFLQPLLEMNSMLQDLAYSKKFIDADNKNTTIFNLSNATKNISTQ